MPLTASVITTSQWGARPPRNAPFARRIPLYVVIHHVDSGNPPHDSSRRTRPGAVDLARSIQKFHMDTRGWSDTGQNFLNTTGAFILEGRHGSLDAVNHGACIQSAHAAQDRPQGGKVYLAYGNHSPGIENEGNFNAFDMIQAQWTSLVELCADLCASCNLLPEHIVGHREFASTDCPGHRLYADLPRLRTDVADHMGVAIPRGREQNRWPIDVPVRHGDRGPTVLLLQHALKTAGHDPGVLDGMFADMTRIGILNYQRAEGLTASGFFDRRTRESLGV